MPRVLQLDEIRDTVSELGRKYGLERAYLFGSYARGTATEESDIDLLIDTEGTDIRSLLDLAAVYCDLEEALKKPVDLLTLSSITQEARMPSDAAFREAVIEERKVLYAVA